MSFIIKVKNLWWKYSASPDWVLKDINFEVKRGECLGIVGPTGAGKTTLLMCLNGLLPHNITGQMKGEILVGGMNTKEHEVAELARKVGMVFEDAESQFVSLTVEEDIAFGLENLCLPPEEIARRIKWALKTTRLDGFERRNAHELSGGQKARVATASILAMQPEILLLDEPTAELDPIGKAEIFSTIQYLRDKFKITLIIVEHETEELVKFADRIILLDEGRIILEEKSHEIFEKVDFLIDKGVRPPEVTQLFNLFNKEDRLEFGEIPLIEEEALKKVIEYLKEEA